MHIFPEEEVKRSENEGEIKLENKLMGMRIKDEGKVK